MTGSTARSLLRPLTFGADIAVASIMSVRIVNYMQYRSLYYSHGAVASSSSASSARAERIVTHLALGAARLDLVAATAHALVEQLGEERLVQPLAARLILRGKRPRSAATCDG